MNVSDGNQDEYPATGSMVDRSVKAFEDAWRLGRRPAIESFLCGDGAERQAVLKGLVHEDMERRLKAGDSVRVEEYLRRFPELRDDAHAVDELIDTEFRLRRVAPDCREREYAERFPEYRSEHPTRPQPRAKAVPEVSAADRGGLAEASLATPVSLLASLRGADNAAAWGRFAEMYTPLLFHWAKRSGLQDADAADLVQEVFAVLVRKLPAFRYESGGSFRGWLHTVLLNKWRELRRRQHSAGTGVPLDSLAAPESIEPLGDEEYRSELIRRALGVLRRDFQAAMWEAFWRTTALGRPAREVAPELGMTANAVHAAKARVLRRFAKNLKD